MKKTDLCRAFLAAPAVWMTAYLVSLPVYYFALIWCGGRYAFYIENSYIAAFAAAGFFGFRPLSKIIRDDGDGDVCILSSMILVIIILAVFRGKALYGTALAEVLYPDGLIYRSGLSFSGGLTAENLKDLMKFSSIYICTYASAFCMAFAMFGRAKWDEYMPVFAAEIRRLLGHEEMAAADGCAGEDTADSTGASAESRKEKIREELRRKLYAEFGGLPEAEDMIKAEAGKRKQRENFRDRDRTRKTG